MSTTITILFIAAICLLLYKLRRLRSSPAQALPELDLETMSQYLDDARDEQLRRSLSPAEFRLHQRKERRALLAYLRMMSRFLDARIRALTSAEVRDAEQADLFIHARQLVLRAQALLWLSFLLPGHRIEQAQEYCRALFDSLGHEMLTAGSSPQ